MKFQLINNSTYSDFLIDCVLSDCKVPYRINQLIPYNTKLPTSCKTTVEASNRFYSLNITEINKILSDSTVPPLWKVAIIRSKVLNKLVVLPVPDHSL